MNTYIPDMKALWMAENVIASLHNIYTLRGAQVRDPLNWSKYIAEALYRFGLEAEVMFASHHWPRWGNERDSGGAPRPARPLRPHEQPGAAPRQPGRDDQPDPQRLRGAEGPAGKVVLPRLSWFAPAQRRGVDPALPGFLGLQPDDPHPAVARRLRPAVRRDDGRRREDPRRGPRAARRGQVPARQ